MTVHTPLARDAEACQKAAEALWAIATSDDRTLSAGDGPAYRALERGFVAAVRAVYRVSPLVAQRTRDLLAEYGPNDGLVGTNTWGVESYVAFARDRRNYRRNCRR